MKLPKMKYDDNGLIPAVVQDYRTGEVLMVAYMNAASLRRTLKSGKACFWSRSRKKFWLKGEESGNFLLVKNILLDCDADTLVVKANPLGPGVCHAGYRTCFYRRLAPSGKTTIVQKQTYDPRRVYKK